MATKQRAALDTGSELSEAATVWETALASEEGEEREISTEGVEEDVEDKEVEEDLNDHEYEDDLEGEDGEEDEEEDPDEDEDEGEEGEPQEVDLGSKIKVKVNGEESEVTLSELRDGYTRTQDYTQKTQKLAEESRQVEAGKAEVLQQQQQWSNLLGQMAERLQAGLSNRSEAEWQQLKDYDEIQYYQEREQERGVQERLQAMEQERQRVHQETQQHQQKLIQEHVQQEGQKLMEKVQEWQDPEVFAKDKASILEYGQELGFSQDELSNVSDHRAIMALRDAAKYRELMATKEKKPGKSKIRRKTMPSGTPSNEPAGKVKAKKASRRHTKDRSVKSAVDVFDSILSQE